jgi:hypothetical protein
MQRARPVDDKSAERTPPTITPEAKAWLVSLASVAADPVARRRSGPGAGGGRGSREGKIAAIISGG